MPFTNHFPFLHGRACTFSVLVHTDLSLLPFCSAIYLVYQLSVSFFVTAFDLLYSPYCTLCTCLFSQNKIPRTYFYSVLFILLCLPLTYSRLFLSHIHFSIRIHFLNPTILHSTLLYSTLLYSTLLYLTHRDNEGQPQAGCEDRVCQNIILNLPGGAIK